MKRQMNSQWTTYKQLESIAEDVPEPQPSASIIVNRLIAIRQSFVTQAVDKLDDGQQLGHLEKCLQLDGSDKNTGWSKAWRRIWQVLNQPLFELNYSNSSEPEIRRVTDGGQIWWYAYDPLTGQSTYLESEEEVQIWLEERLQYFYR